MSVMIGGTAANGFSAGGSRSGSAGSAGIVMTFSAFHSEPSRNQRQTDPERSSVEITTPTKPQVASGSWDGRTSSAIWCCAPRSMRCSCSPVARFQKWIACPYFWPSSRSGTRPSSIIEGLPHSLETSTFWLRCHHAS